MNTPHARSAVAPDPLRSKFVDRYELLRKIATGGMAELYLAKQTGLEGFEKVIAIKKILTHLAEDAEFVGMFLDEARIAAKLSHPNIVQIYDLGYDSESHYIAMEYVAGRNVQHIIEKEAKKNKRIPIEHVCRIMAGVCDGLYYAHSRKDYDNKPLNIVHRDISPQNILVSFSGGVKVVDFGIAKASTQLAQTRAGVLKGKYSYMSPEQVRGQKIDHRSDIFALGLVMYEMLTGIRAFEKDNSLKTLKAIVYDKPLNPREINPEIPIELVKLLAKALEKNPDKRYQNAQDMQLALEDYLENSPKKSNNVRLSRYMYDIFDDELHTADGTMLVKGVGEVIIATRAANAGDLSLMPVENGIDEKTLASVLLPDMLDDKPNGVKNDGDSTKIEDVTFVPRAGNQGPLAQQQGANVGQNQQGYTPKAPTARKPANVEIASALMRDDDAILKDVENEIARELGGEHSNDDGLDDDDGATVPAFDLEEYERRRNDMLAKGQDLRAAGSDGLHRKEVPTPQKPAMTPTAIPANAAAQKVIPTPKPSSTLQAFSAVNLPNVPERPNYANNQQGAPQQPAATIQAMPAHQGPLHSEDLEARMTRQQPMVNPAMLSSLSTAQAASKNLHLRNDDQAAALLAKVDALAADVGTAPPANKPIGSSASSTTSYAFGGLVQQAQQIDAQGASSAAPIQPVQPNAPANTSLYSVEALGGMSGAVRPTIRPAAQSGQQGTNPHTGQNTPASGTQPSPSGYQSAQAPTATTQLPSFANNGLPPVALPEIPDVQPASAWSGGWWDKLKNQPPVVLGLLIATVCLVVIGIVGVVVVTLFSDDNGTKTNTIVEYGVLKVTTDPAGAQVTVDGKTYTSPADVSLQVGRPYDVKIEWAGKPSVVEKVQMQSGEDVKKLHKALGK